MVDTDKTIPAGGTDTVASGDTETGDPLVIAGQYNIAGQHTVVPDYQPAPTFAGGTTVTTTTTRERVTTAATQAGALLAATTERERTTSATLQLGATLIATTEVFVPLIRQSNRGVAWHETEDRTLNADSDQ